MIQIQLSAENTIRLPDRALEKLPDFLRQQRWFGGKAQAIDSIKVLDVLPFATPAVAAHFVLLQVQYREGSRENYSVPFIEAHRRTDIPLLAGKPAPHIEVGESKPFFFYDAIANESFLNALLTAVAEDRRFRSDAGELQMFHSAALRELLPHSSRVDGLAPRLMRAEQSNTSIVYGDRLVLKLFRRVEQGVNPDVEIGRFLTERTSYRNVPLLAGSLEYARDDGTRMSMGILQNFVPNQGDAWQFTLRELDRYFDAVRSSGLDHPSAVPTMSLLQLKAQPVPDQAEQLIGSYLASARLLGRRTAELHLALSKTTGDPAFDPEPYSAPDQRAFVERALDLLRRNFTLLRQHAPSLPASVREEASHVLDHVPALERRFRSFEDRQFTSLRTRIHGDYHLGQVLVTNDDFVIIDFEGEPARPISDRRKKHSPLQDVAGMLRSFHYAAYAPLLGASSTETSLPLGLFEPWAYFWQMWVSAAFLHSYFDTAASASFLSRDTKETATILQLHLLEKSIYELGYELNNRPSWVRIPLSGVAQLLLGPNNLT